MAVPTAASANQPCATARAFQTDELPDGTATILFVEDEEFVPGVVYIAPSGIHMTVERLHNSQAVISLVRQPEDHLHVPSVDIMMESVSAAFPGQVMGVIMTGMGSDGALGMQAIHRQGGLTVGQDEASCTVYGMPKACAELGILHRVVPLLQIPQQILRATRYCRSASLETTVVRL